MPNALFTHRLAVWVFGILGLMSIIWFKERTIMLDVSFHTFHILRKGDFMIMVNRFGAAMTEIFPLAALKLGASLRVILMSYSVGFVIFHALMFWICQKVLKNTAFALVIVLFNVLFVTHTFFWIQNEIIQATSLLCLFFALLPHLSADVKSRFKTLALVFALLVLAVTLAYFHPLVVFPFFFAWVFLLLKNAGGQPHERYVPSNRQLWWALATFGLGLLAKYVVTKSNWYDRASMERLEANLKLPFDQFLRAKSHVDFAHYCLSDFYFLPILAVFITIFYWKKRIWTRLAWLWVSLIGFVAVINWTYMDGGEQFYMESQYLPMAIFLLVPLVFDVLPSVKSPRMAFWALFGLASVKLLHIGLTSAAYTQRVVYLTQLTNDVRAKGVTKAIISDKKVDAKLLKMTWGSAFETLLLSSLDGTMPAVSVLIDENPARFSDKLAEKKLFLGEFENYPYEALNARYFTFDTTSTYQILE